MFDGEALSRMSESFRFSAASLFIAGQNCLGVSRRVFSSQVGLIYAFHYESCSPLQVGFVYVFHGESLPRWSGSSRCFTASLLLAGLINLGVARRNSILQVGVVKVFHGGSLHCKWESFRCFTASFVLAGRNRLRVSRRMASAQVGIV